LKGGRTSGIVLLLRSVRVRSEYRAHRPASNLQISLEAFSFGR
jgi:hypothetical protein